jgi:asparagine synthetase B (glutamine-hydrolysing)
MSDFIYSNITKSKGELTHTIHSIYHTDFPEVFEYHGEWGSLAVSRNLYNGFQPLENKSHIIVVIGGPVLCFRDNLFLTGNDSVAGTQAIFDQWQSSAIKWDVDLSGPFALLIVDKEKKQVTCITDLMMSIPVYRYSKNNMFMLGTHVDALSKATGLTQEFDPVSLVDFILNNSVTYPYTSYKNIRQCHPAATHNYQLLNGKIKENGPSLYWSPSEINTYTNIKDAANILREGLQDYVNRITEGMTQVAQFLSAGEDTRTISGLLPQTLERDAFIFIDSMNREGRIAKKVAKIYGAKFHAMFRKPAYYLDILPEASDLIGSGHQYIHAHSLGFHKTCKLRNYSAVFGGFLSDTLLKGNHIKKIKSCERFNFLPQFKDKNTFPVYSKNSGLKNKIDKTIYNELTKRRKEHYKWIKKIRIKSFNEWFIIWPISKLDTIPNFHINRRLFRSYEPYMSNQVVKVCAAVRTSWKLNHRLFYRMAKPLIEPAKYLSHTNGRMPYYPWYINLFIQPSIRLWRRVEKRKNRLKDNQGPWCDWHAVMKSREWKSWEKKYSTGKSPVQDIFSDPIHQLLKDDDLLRGQKINLLQVLYQIDRK